MLDRLFLVLGLVLYGVAQTAPQTGVVTGRIFTATETPAARVRVAAVAALNSGRGETAIMSLAETDAAGNFRLESLPAGRYYIVAGAVSRPTYYPGVADQGAAIALEVAAGKSVDGIVFTTVVPVAPPTASRGGAPPSSASLQVVLYDRGGKVIRKLEALVAPVGSVAISPDGKRVALDHGGVIVVIDAATGAATSISQGPGDRNPAWSEDGSRIVFQSPRGIFIVRSDGLGREELISGPITPGFVTGWGGHEKLVAFHIQQSGTGNDLWAISVADGRPIPLLATPATELGPRISPDGRYLAYRSDESRRNEVYVRPIDPSTRQAALPVVQVSTQGSVGMARWRDDGRELYFIGSAGEVMAVEMSTTPELRAGPPRVLFTTPREFPITGTPGNFADASADGQVFVLMTPAPRGSAPTLSPQPSGRP